MGWFKKKDVDARNDQAEAEEPDVEQARQLLLDAQEIEEDPRSLNLQLEAGRLLLLHRRTQEIVDLLQDLLGYRWQYGYYSRPQYDRVQAFLDETLDAYDTREGLGELASAVHGSLLGGEVSTLLHVIADRLVALKDFSGAMALMDRLAALAGPNPEGWKRVRSEDPRRHIEAKIREAKGLPPLPRPERPPRPEPPRDLARETQNAIRREAESALDAVLAKMDYPYDFGLLPHEEREAVDRELDRLLEERSARGQLSLLADRVRFTWSPGRSLAAARIAIRMHRSGDIESAVRLQRWLASWEHARESGNNARRKSEALDLLDPILGALPREFAPLTRKDSTYELACEEDLARGYGVGPIRHSCRAAMLRLGLGDWQVAFRHVVNALGLARIASEPIPEDLTREIDETTRTVLLLWNPLERWPEYLLEEGLSFYDIKRSENFLLLGWIGAEQARLGRRDEALSIRDKLAATVVESWDDFELQYTDEARVHAIARIDAALLSYEST